VAAILDRLHIDVAEITGWLVIAKIANIGQVAASVDDVHIAVLANEPLRLGHILGRSA